MLLHPCLHLILEILGDIDRTGLAAVLEGQLAATAALGAKGCSQGRTSRDKFLDPGVPHPPQQSGVFRELHGILLNTKYTYLVLEGKKIPSAKKENLITGKRAPSDYARTHRLEVFQPGPARCEKL
jgi:hypothetical protein